MRYQRRIQWDFDTVDAVSNSGVPKKHEKREKEKENKFAQT